MGTAADQPAKPTIAGALNTPPAGPRPPLLRLTADNGTAAGPAGTGRLRPGGFGAARGGGTTGPPANPTRDCRSCACALRKASRRFRQRDLRRGRPGPGPAGECGAVRCGPGAFPAAQAPPSPGALGRRAGRRRAPPWKRRGFAAGPGSRVTAVLCSGRQ